MKVIKCLCSCIRQVGKETKNPNHDLEMTQTLNLWPLLFSSPGESREDERTCKRGYSAPLAWRVLRVSRTRACVFCLYFRRLVSVSEQISSFFFLATVVLRRWEIETLGLSNELRSNYHREGFGELTFRA